MTSTGSRGDVAEGVKVPFVVILASRKICKKGEICRNSCIKNEFSLISHWRILTIYSA